MFLAAVLGIGIGMVFGDSIASDEGSDFYQLILLFKSLFLSALRMLIAPMIFFSLISGIIGIGNIVRLRQLGGITIAYYFSTTLIAILLGLVAVFFIHPWTNYPATIGMESTLPTTRLIEAGNDSIILVLQQVFELALSNPVSALADLNILGIVTNAILIGLAMVVVLPPESPLIRMIEQINIVIVQILRWVIRILPIGVFAILMDFAVQMNTTDGNSGSLLVQLFQFGLLVVGLTLVHGLVVLPAIAWLLARKSPYALFSEILQPMIVAFSTSSSSATLPVSMRTCEEKLKISNSVTSFVLPLGATMNMDGTALFEAVAAIFLAYLFGVELSNVAIMTVFLMAMIASIGAPGMPSASMAGMQMVLLAVGIPLEAIAILLVIERPLDTIRTAINVEGDIVGTLVVSRFTQKSDEEIQDVSVQSTE